MSFQLLVRPHWPMGWFVSLDDTWQARLSHILPEK